MLHLRHSAEAQQREQDGIGEQHAIAQSQIVDQQTGQQGRADLSRHGKGVIIAGVFAGVAGGAQFVEFFKPVYFLYGVAMTLVPMIVGYIFANVSK